MTVNEPVELLFRCRMEGGAEIDKLAASVQGVSGAAAVASQGLTSLETALAALTAEVAANTAALAGMEGGCDRVAGGAARATVSTKALTNEMKMLEGAMPIKAAASFLANLGGIGAAMQMAFPIFGAVALIGYLDTLIEKTGLMPKQWDEVAEAQKSSLDMLQKSSKEYDRHLEKLKAIAKEQFELTHGKDAARAQDAFELRFKAGSVDAQEIARLEKQVEALRVFAGKTSGFGADQQTRYYAGLAGLSSAEDDNLVQYELPWGMNGTSFSSRQEAAKDLLPGFEMRLRDAQANKQVDEKSADLEDNKTSADQKKHAQEEATKRQHQLAELEKQASAALRSAQTFELTGLAKIAAEHENRLGKLREEIALLGQLSAAEKTRADAAIGKENQAYGIEVKRELDHIQKQNAQHIAGLVADIEKDADKQREFTAKQFLANLKKEIEQESKDIAAGLKVLQASDDTDADAVRRSLGATLKSNSLSVKGGTMTGSSAAGADYGARVAAAEEIFRIETQHLGLIDDKGKQEEKLATARKKYADEIFRAEESYQNQLEALREQDLKKYEQMAGSIFDALHGHSMNQWFRNFALGQEKQIFTNVATPVLQNAGHALGGLIPNINVPGIGNPLKGTIFDNSNVDPAKDTARNTFDTVDQIKGLRRDIIKLTGGTPAAGTLGDASDLFNLPTINRNNPLGAIFGSDMGGWTGNGPLGGGSTGMPGASSLFNAGGGSGFTQFFSGLTGMGSNPLQAIFSGMSTNGSTVTQLTTAQQVGAAVGTAAMLAGAGMSIASGISQGGVGGISKAVGAGAGAVAMLDPEPISKTILTAVSAVSGIVSSLFGTGPQQRSKDIAEYLAKNQYLAPTAMNVMQGMNGTYSDFDARGNLRTSSMSAVPTVAEPYITSKVIDGQRQYYDVPGNTLTPYTGGARGTGQAPVSNVTNNYVQAMDVQSFHDFVRRTGNAISIGHAVADALQNGSVGRLSSELIFNQPGNY